MSGDKHTGADHSHDHEHGHDAAGHAAGEPFVPETSLYDRALSLLVVIAAVGLVGYMIYWMTVPLSLAEVETKGATEEVRK
jgi:hypothetical protein